METVALFGITCLWHLSGTTQRCVFTWLLGDSPLVMSGHILSVSEKEGEGAPRARRERGRRGPRLTLWISRLAAQELGGIGCQRARVPRIGAQLGGQR
jgi:hypothetical protein